MQVWPTIERFIAEQGAAALVTVVAVRGSSPRDVGARMVVRPDGGFSGTIGGGALEWAALADAQALLANRSGSPVRRLDKALGPDLGQCCGGRVTVMIERFSAADLDAIAPLAGAERNGPIATAATRDASGRWHRRVLAAAETERLFPADSYLRIGEERVLERFGFDPTPLLLFGAGHVGRALALALAPLPFAVTWIDPRPGAFPSHVPGNVMCVGGNEPTRVIGGARDGSFVAVMTHSHALDLDLVAAALKAGRFPYVGLIGSATKRARFVSTLGKLGVEPSAIERLTCPIGLREVRDKAPAAIAASIAAQLLIARETLSRPASRDHRTAPIRTERRSTRHA